MYDDIIEEFRKEYEKEIRSIFDNSGVKEGREAGRKMTPNRISRKWLRHFSDRHILRKPRRDTCSSITLLPIIEKYAEQLCKKYEQYGEDDLMSILPELGASGDTPIVKFAKSIHVMYSIITLDYIPKKWVDNAFSEYEYFRTVMSREEWNYRRKIWKHAGIDRFEINWLGGYKRSRVSPLKIILMHSPLKELKYGSVEHIDIAYRKINSSFIKPISKVKDSVKTLIEISPQLCNWSSESCVSNWPPYLLTYLEYYEESEWKDLYEKLRVRSVDIEEYEKCANISNTNTKEIEKIINITNLRWAINR